MNLNMLTEKAQEAVVAASRLASTLSHAQVDPEHDLRRRVERERRGWPATGRGGLAGGRDQAGGHERVDTPGDGGPGLAGEGRQLGAGPVDVMPYLVG